MNSNLVNQETVCVELDVSDSSDVDHVDLTEIFLDDVSLIDETIVEFIKSNGNISMMFCVKFPFVQETASLIDTRTLKLTLNSSNDSSSDMTEFSRNLTVTYPEPDPISPSSSNTVIAVTVSLISLCVIVVLIYVGRRVYIGRRDHLLLEKGLMRSWMHSKSLLRKSGWTKMENVIKRSGEEMTYSFTISNGDVVSENFV